VAPDSADEVLTCPRCLAIVANPGWRRGASGVQNAADDRPERQAVCQECGEPVDREWRYCPNCQEPLRERGRRRRTADIDVRRDSKGTSVVLILLAVVGCLGLSLMVPLAVGQAAGAGDLTVLGWFVAGSFLVGVLAVVTVLAGNRNQGPAAAVGSIAFRSLAIAGVVFLALSLFCVASGIVLLVACARNGPF
jgi:hypothetical protein